jgi:dihydropteroate synthase
MARMSFLQNCGTGPPNDAMSPSATHLRPRPRFLWNLRSRTLALGDRTLIMAIINLTPDSFSGDGLVPPNAITPASIKLAAATAIHALDSGADILDIGAESTRPNASPLAPEEEQARLLPVLEAILHHRPSAILSVDTYHASTALAAARLGVEIINDVSGLTWDPNMAAAVAETHCGLVLMHTRGRPREWLAQGPMTAHEILPAVFAGLCESLAIAEAAGIPTNHIIADPGFGFGKRGDENFTLLANLSRLHELGCPLLIGLSRKGFLGEAIGPVQPPNFSPDPALTRRSATLAANTAAILAGAHILRVHDIQPTREAAAIADAILHNITSAPAEN